MKASGEWGGARAVGGPAVAVAVVAALVGTASSAAVGRSDEPAKAPAAATFCALVESLPPSRRVGAWRVGGMAVHVGAGTAVDRTQAEPARGISAVVVGERLGDGSVRAATIALRAAGCGVNVGASDPPPAPDVARTQPDGTPGVLGVGALAGGRPGSSGVAVATAEGGAHALALSVAGLRPGERYELAIDGARAATVVAAADGTVRAELVRAPLVGATAGDRPRVRVELVDATGAVAVSGELRAVTAPRDGSMRASR